MAIYLNTAPAKGFVSWDKDTIIFNMEFFINKYHTMQTDPMYLYYLIMKNYAGQTLFFDCIDGEDILITGFYAFIQKIKRDLNIPKEKLLVRMYSNNTDFPDITVVKALPSPFRTGLKFHTHDIQNDTFTHRFLAMYSRTDVFRVLTAKFLHERYPRDSLISLKNSQRAADDFERHANSFDNEFDLVLDWLKQVGNTLRVDDAGGEFYTSWEDTAKASKELNSRYLIDVAIETNTLSDSYWTTEKVYRPMASGKPFIVYGGCGLLRYLHSQGFKTFSPWINESYDDIANDYDRFQAFLAELDRIGKMSIAELKMMAMALNDVLVWNKLQIAHS
jgi:hypothetical protein